MLSAMQAVGDVPLARVGQCCVLSDGMCRCTGTRTSMLRALALWRLPVKPRSRCHDRLYISPVADALIFASVGPPRLSSNVWGVVK